MRLTREPGASDGEVARRDDVGGLLVRLSTERLDPRTRAGLLARLGRALLTAARAAAAAGIGGGRWLAEMVVETAPRIPIRDLASLREQHDGLTGDALAEALVSNASRVTAGVGAAGGALASVEFAAPPTLLSAPVQIVAETLVAVAVEVKLVAELHEVYGATPPGTVAQRAPAYVTSWARRRAIDPVASTASLPVVVAGAARRELRQRMLRRAGRNLTTLAPFLAGAVAGAELNRRETRRLGDALVRDLRRRTR